MNPIFRADNYEHTTIDVMYVTNNIPGPGIDVEDFESEFSVGCDCKENCETNCSCVRGINNYLNNRINVIKLSEMIIECNSRCNCDDNCTNKLVQRGPIDCLEIIKTGSKGLGLKTNKKILENSFICEYAGEIIGIEEAKRRVGETMRNGLMNYILVVSEHVGDDKIITCIDPKYFGNIGRYCNHSCRANSRLVPIRIEALAPRLCLFARRDINVDEEITFDYAGGLVKSSDNISEIPCFCGEDCCLGYLPHFPF